MSEIRDVYVDGVRIPVSGRCLLQPSNPCEVRFADSANLIAIYADESVNLDASTYCGRSGMIMSCESTNTFSPWNNVLSEVSDAWQTTSTMTAIADASQWADISASGTWGDPQPSGFLGGCNTCSPSADAIWADGCHRHGYFRLEITISARADALSAANSADQQFGFDETHDGLVDGASSSMSGDGDQANGGDGGENDGGVIGGIVSGIVVVAVVAVVVGLVIRRRRHTASRSVDVTEVGRHSRAVSFLAGRTHAQSNTEPLTCSTDSSKITVNEPGDFTRI